MVAPLPKLYDGGDPYLAWSSATNFAGHVAVHKNDSHDIPVLLELSSAKGTPSNRPGAVRIAGAWGAGDRFVTGVAPKSALAMLQQSVKCLEFGLPIAAGAIDTTPVQMQPGSQEAVVFAVIDRGCAFLHRNFRHLSHPKRTRLLGLWEQGRAATGSPWTVPAGFGYGRELDAGAIDHMLAALAVGSVSEAEIYAELDCLLGDTGQVRDFAHGTHVLDAGAGLVLDQSARSSAKPAQEDQASTVPLLFVDVPGLAKGDTTGASSAPFCLAALRYIRLRAGRDTRVLVNISLGALAGPHDGSSLIERAIDDLVKRDGNMVITIASGNAGDGEVDRWHAHGQVLSRTDGASLAWRLRPDDPTDSFVEVWFKPSSEQPVQPRVRLTSPSGASTGWITVGGSHAEIAARSGHGALAAAVYTRPAGERGKDAMALIAVAPCADSRMAAEPGLWHIDLGAEDGYPGLFDAYVQRDEPIWTGNTPIQSFFEQVTGHATVSGSGSLNNLASGEYPLVIGAADDASRQVTRYTARGVAKTLADRRPVRDIDTFCIADESPHVVGLFAAGVLSGSYQRMGGTSVAAPRAARRLINRLVDLKQQFPGKLLVQTKKLVPPGGPKLFED